MNKLLIVFIFCLAQQALVECGVVYDIIGGVSNIAGNIQEAVTDKLLSFKNLVQSLVERGVDSVEDIVNTVIDSGFQVKAACIYLLQTAVESTQKRIFGMVEDAIKDGKDASHCIVSLTADSVDSITNEMTSCIEANVLGCREYMSQGLERIRDFLSISGKFDGEIKNCGVGILSVGCIGMILGKIAVEAIVVVGKVAELVKDVVDSILLFKNKFLSCQGIALVSSAGLFGKFITEVGECIDKCVKVNLLAIGSDSSTYNTPITTTSSTTTSSSATTTRSTKTTSRTKKTRSTTTTTELIEMDFDNKAECISNCDL